MAGGHQVVYVCVSGEDVPDGFLSHLKGGLESKGFSVFTHEGKMREEAKNRHKILNRIRVSRFVLVIFSDEFGGSAECLDNLVLVMKRMYLGKLRTIPIYYMMHQHEPKYQKGYFGYMLDQLEKAENRKAAGKSVEAMIHTEVRFNEWREALAFVTNKKGFEFHHQGDSLDSTFIEEIAKHIIEGGHGSISEPQETQTKCQLFGTPVYEDEVVEEHYMAREDQMKAMVSSLKKMDIILEGDYSSEPDFTEKISELVKEKLRTLVHTNFLTLTPAESPKPDMKPGQVFISYSGYRKMSMLHIDHLINSLATHGMTASEGGDNTIWKVIKYFWITLVIFSRHYAGSIVSMDELLIIKKHAEDGNMIVLPIFYNCNPSDVTHQTGTFGISFDLLLQRSMTSNGDNGMIKRVPEWKEALRFVGEIDGLVFEDLSLVSEPERVSQIVESIKKRLSQIVVLGKK